MVGPGCEVARLRRESDEHLVTKVLPNGMIRVVDLDRDVVSGVWCPRTCGFIDMDELAGYDRERGGPQ